MHPTVRPSSRPPRPLKHTLWLVALVAATSSSFGCATGLFGSSQDDRKQAIRACTQEVPADAVPYGDAIAACMEKRGYVYTGASGPRR